MFQLQPNQLDSFDASRSPSFVSIRHGYFSDFSRIEAKLKRKARASLKAKKRAFQLGEQQLTDMIVQDGALHHQFAAIEDLLRARASDAAFQSELNEFYDLFSAKKSPEKDVPIHGSDNLMKELDIAENEDKLPRRLNEVTEDSVRAIRSIRGY